MKAILDHVGIAVRHLDEALAFYRDALGLEIEAPEEVPSQRVRAHFVPVGESALELLEGTSPDSAISKYVEKRGPGIHHVTLRVPDIVQALDRLKDKGVRLVDASPRPGAEGGLVAFVHPSAAHGVLVELKQAAPIVIAQPVQRASWGDLQLTSLSDGAFRLDAGSMFGIVPRPMWEPLVEVDDRGRLVMAMRALLVEGEWGRLLIDCGVGDSLDPRKQDIFGVDRTRNLTHTLAEAGVAPDQIDIVLPTHLHFDHVGGAFQTVAGERQPAFPRARYIVRRGELEDARQPHARARGSYAAADIAAFARVPGLEVFDEDREIVPGVRVMRAPGHTAHQQIVVIASGGRTAVFAADVVPTTAHVNDLWIPAFDMLPTESYAFKSRFIREAIDREYLVWFDHDPAVSAGYIRERDGRRVVEPVVV